MKLKIAGSLVLISMLTVAPSCWAQDYLDLIKGMIGKGGFSSQSQGTIITNLNTRQAQLESQIQAGAASGQLSSREESELRSELNTIANTQGQFLSQGPLSDYQVQTLLNEFNNLTMKLQAFLSNRTVTSTSTYNSGWFNRYGRGNMTGDPGNQAQFRANIDTKQAMIDASINQAVMAGNLSWRDARNFRNQLNDIANREQSLLADGRLSYGDSRTLISALNSLESQVNTQIQIGRRNRNPNPWGNNDWNNGRWNRHATGLGYNGSYASQRIQRGLAMGQLTQREASGLMRDIQTASSLQARLSSSSGMSVAEQNMLLGQISQINSKINDQLNSKRVQ